MSHGTDAPAPPTLSVADKVLAKIAAYEAGQVTGVLRLRPHATQAAMTALRSATTSATTRVTGTRATGAKSSVADPAAVGVEQDTQRNTVTVTLRVTTATQPPVLRIVAALQERISERLRVLTGFDPVVVVNVLDVEPSG